VRLVRVVESKEATFVTKGVIAKFALDSDFLSKQLPVLLSSPEEISRNPKTEILFANGVPLYSEPQPNRKTLFPAT